MSTAEAEIPSRSGVALRWIFNPFYYVAGTESLAAGVAVLVVTAFICGLSASHLDGVLDFHMGQGAPWWVYPVEGLVNWLFLATLLYLAGKMLSQSAVRAVDVYGTQALARIPYVFLAVAFALPWVRNATNRVTTHLVEIATSGKIVTSPFAGLPASDLLVFMFASMLTLAALVWMIILMYRSFSVSCNVRGVKAIIVFTVLLVVAEVLSKAVLFGVYESAGVGSPA